MKKTREDTLKSMRKNYQRDVKDFKKQIIRELDLVSKRKKDGPFSYMRHITIICDRCKKSIDGLIAMEGYSDQVTSGFYDVSFGYWERFKREKNEKWVCDNCIQLDPLYKLSITEMTF